MRKRRSLQCLPVRFASISPITFPSLHDCEASPLYPHLGNPKESRETLKTGYFAAANKICTTGRESEYVGKGKGSRRSPQQYKIGRYSFRRAPRDYAMVLGEIRDENADEYQSRQINISDLSTVSKRISRYAHGESKIQVAWRC